MAVIIVLLQALDQRDIRLILAVDSRHCLVGEVGRCLVDSVSTQPISVEGCPVMQLIAVVGVIVLRSKPTEVSVVVIVYNGRIAGCERRGVDDPLPGKIHGRLQFLSVLKNINIRAFIAGIVDDILQFIGGHTAVQAVADVASGSVIITLGLQRNDPLHIADVIGRDHADLSHRFGIRRVANIL